MQFETTITCDTPTKAQTAADTMISASGSTSLVSNFNKQAASAGLSVSASSASSTSTVTQTPSDSSSDVQWWIIMLSIVVPLIMFAVIGVLIWKIRSTTHDTSQMAPQEAHKAQEMVHKTQEIPHKTQEIPSDLEQQL